MGVGSAWYAEIDNTNCCQPTASLYEESTGPAGYKSGGQGGSQQRAGAAGDCPQPTVPNNRTVLLCAAHSNARLSWRDCGHECVKLR